MPDFYFISSRGHKRLRRHVAAHDVPWRGKVDSLYWRGSTCGHHRQRDNLRARLVRRCAQVGDVAFSRILPHHSKFKRVNVDQPRPISEFLGHRYLVDIDGYSCSWDGLFWKLLSGSLVLKDVSGDRQWYYDRLQPWVHYVPFTRQNPRQALAWCQRHPEAARGIAREGQKLARQISFTGELRLFAKRLAIRVGVRR